MKIIALLSFMFATHLLAQEPQKIINLPHDYDVRIWMSQDIESKEAASSGCRRLEMSIVKSIQAKFDDLRANYTSIQSKSWVRRVSDTPKKRAQCELAIELNDDEYSLNLLSSSVKLGENDTDIKKEEAKVLHASNPDVVFTQVSQGFLKQFLVFRGTQNNKKKLYVDSLVITKKQ